MERDTKPHRPILMARELYEHLGLSPPVDVMAAIHASGVHLLEIPGVPIDKATLAYHRKCRSFAICVHPMGDQNKQRVSMARQLGHFLLHREFIELGVTDLCAIPELSSEASLFAGELLVPEHELRCACFRRRMASFQADRTCLAGEMESTFRVPRVFWRRRLRQLGYKNCSEILATMV